MVRTVPDPTLKRVVFQKGGATAVMLDSVLRVFPERVELFDVHPGGQLLVSSS